MLSVTGPAPPQGHQERAGPFEKPSPACDTTVMCIVELGPHVRGWRGGERCWAWLVNSNLLCTSLPATHPLSWSMSLFSRVLGGILGVVRLVFGLRLMSFDLIERFKADRGILEPTYVLL